MEWIGLQILSAVSSDSRFTGAQSAKLSATEGLSKVVFKTATILPAEANWCHSHDVPRERCRSFSGSYWAEMPDPIGQGRRSGVLATSEITHRPRRPATLGQRFTVAGMSHHSPQAAQSTQENRPYEDHSVS